MALLRYTASTPYEDRNHNMPYIVPYTYILGIPVHRAVYPYLGLHNRILCRIVVSKSQKGGYILPYIDSTKHNGSAEHTFYMQLPDYCLIMTSTYIIMTSTYIITILHSPPPLQCIHSVTRRKLQTPGIAEEHKRQETPTINPIGPTDTPHRPSTTERTARETHNTN